MPQCNICGCLLQGGAQTCWLLQEAEDFSWTKQWWPVQALVNLDPSKPFATKLLGVLRDWQHCPQPSCSAPCIYSPCWYAHGRQQAIMEASLL